MAVKIRLKRIGKVKKPFYRVVVADSRTKRDGKVIEQVGKYHPLQNPSFIEINSNRAQYWLSVGAQPTEQVLALLKLTGDWSRFRGEENPVSRVEVAKPKAGFTPLKNKKSVLIEKPAKQSKDKPNDAESEVVSNDSAPSTDADFADTTPSIRGDTPDQDLGVTAVNESSGEADRKTTPPDAIQSTIDEAKSDTDAVVTGIGHSDETGSAPGTSSPEK